MRLFVILLLLVIESARGGRTNSDSVRSTPNDTPIDRDRQRKSLHLRGLKSSQPDGETDERRQHLHVGVAPAAHARTRAGGVGSASPIDTASDQDRSTRRATDVQLQEQLGHSAGRALAPDESATAEVETTEESTENLPNKQSKQQQNNDGQNGSNVQKDEEDDLAAIKEELAEEQRMVREVGGYGALLGMIAMVFTAWQMNDNPDGIFATMCRLVITICGLIINLLLVPCRRCIGLPRSHSYGHVPGASSNLEFGFT